MFLVEELLGGCQLTTTLSPKLGQPVDEGGKLETLHTHTQYEH